MWPSPVLVGVLVVVASVGTSWIVAVAAVAVVLVVPLLMIVGVLQQLLLISYSSLSQSYCDCGLVENTTPASRVVKWVYSFAKIKSISATHFSEHIAALNVPGHRRPAIRRGPFLITIESTSNWE